MDFRLKYTMQETSHLALLLFVVRLSVFHPGAYACAIDLVAGQPDFMMGQSLFLGTWL